MSLQAMLANVGSDPLVIRLIGACLAAVFLHSAVTKALDRRAAVSEFADTGIQFAPVALPAVIALQLFGSVALLAGVFDRVAALALAVFTIAATLVGHRVAGLHGAERRHKWTTVLEHLAIVGGLLPFASRPDN